ncbi:CD83 antigen [Epinephelus fuscoguttatus]|uniref:CD83 antigen n=1 Tax=Epinephelus fuscoguttatus TaxID=293821 RepID=UPI0020D0007E|nr:CD83 antigen [Epinephelus fuscoguttatus]
MTTHILNLALLLSLCMCHAVSMAVERNMLETITEVGSDCVLECTAKYTPGVQYRAVRWYKVEESSQLSGLLTKDLPNGTTRWYTGVDREVDLLGESRSILLPNVTCADRGVYVCHLAAPVGEQNREGQVLLTLTDCVDSSTEAVVMADAFLVISASVVLMLALVIFFISYGSLKKILRRQTSKTPKKETLLDAPLKPLEKKDLKLIYKLGPKVSKSPTVKNICV